MIQSSKPKAAISPCINVCTLDADSGLCQGCFRSLDEISFWSRASNGQRLNILDAVARRRKELTQ
jgi:hypothetical protein